MIDSKHLKNNIPSSKFLELPQEFGWGLSSASATPVSGLTVVDRFTNKFKCSDVILSLSTGDTSNIVYVDVHKNDISIFNTQTSIDVSGSTSVSAATPFIFSLSAKTISFIDDDEVKFYVSGATDCIGLKVKLIGDRIISLPFVDPDLRYHMPFNGTTEDIFNNDFGAVSGSVSYIQGVNNNQAIDLPLESYIDYNFDGTLDLNKFSVSAWIYINEYQVGWTVWLSYDRTGVSWWNMGLHQTERTLITRIGTSFKTYGPVLLENTWYHIVSTHDNGTRISYINNIEEQNDTSGTSILNSAKPFRVGMNSQGAEKSDIRIEDLRMYSKVLDQTEVNDLYGIGRGYNTDTTAFISVVTGLTQSQETAINDLVVGLKNNGTWDKYLAIYPVIGGTEYNHKYNLKDPRDLDAAFRLSFSGTITHSSTGMVPTADPSYGDTHIEVFSDTLDNNVSLGYYNRTPATHANWIEMGCWEGTNRLSMEIKWGTNPAGGGSFDAYDTATGRARQNLGSWAGYTVGSRQSPTSTRMYFNGTSSGDGIATSGGTRPVLNIYILSVNDDGTPTFVTRRECAFSTIGEGFTETEIANDYTTIQAYQTALGREV